MKNELMIEFIKQIGQALQIAEDATELLLFKYESESEEDQENHGGMLWPFTLDARYVSCAWG